MYPDPFLIKLQNIFLGLVNLAAEKEAPVVIVEVHNTKPFVTFELFCSPSPLPTTCQRSSLILVRVPPFGAGRSGGGH